MEVAIVTVLYHMYAKGVKILLWITNQFKFMLFQGTFLWYAVHTSIFAEYVHRKKGA